MRPRPRDGVEYRSFRDDGRTVVTWDRDGHVRALRQGGAARGPPHARGLARQGALAFCSRSLPDGSECAGEEEERVFARRDAHLLDPPDDDPVIAGGVLSDDLALEGGEGVGE
jgi:hypothetical protein